jgi:hypothetical protein
MCFICNKSYKSYQNLWNHNHKFHNHGNKNKKSEKNINVENVKKNSVTFKIDGDMRKFAKYKIIIQI